MAESANIAILVGEKRTIAIVDGLNEKDFDKSNIYVVGSLTKASQKLQEISKIGDVVLFENDLPDNYNEK